MKRRLEVLVLLTVVCSGLVFAGGVGTTGAQFLKINLDAKPMGMGGAYSAVYGELNGITYNPASLSGITAKEVGVAYSQHFEGVTAGQVNAAMPVKGCVAAAGITYLSVGDVEKRAGDTAAADSSIGASNMMLTLSAAKRDFIKEGVACGANLKIISLSLDDKSASAIAVDLAGLYNFNEKVTVAANLQNLGTGVKFTSVSDPLPMNLKIGAAYKRSGKLLLASDIDYGIGDGVSTVALGAQYMINSMFGLRVGYKSGYDSSLGSIAGLTAGAAFCTSKMGIDLAFVPFGDLGNAVKLSFNMKL